MQKVDVGLSLNQVFPGLQVAYLPDHAFGEIDHPDVEWGFVTSLPESPNGAAFVRYFRSRDSDELRTKANSELTPLDNLYIIEHHPVDLVARLLAGCQAQTILQALADHMEEEEEKRGAP